MNGPATGYPPAWTDDELADAVRFFIIDGDMAMYVIPSRPVAGRTRILLRTYRKYIAGDARGLLGIAAEDGGAGVPAMA